MIKFGSLRHWLCWLHGAAIGLAVGLLAGIFLSPTPANADPCFYGQPCYQPPWNGQLLPTWNQPGYYGGWNNGPVLCSPISVTCQGVAPNPNG